jgi:hypothetical protein
VGETADIVARAIITGHVRVTARVIAAHLPEGCQMIKNNNNLNKEKL